MEENGENRARFDGEDDGGEGLGRLRLRAEIIGEIAGKRFEMGGIVG
jgi:hypothetical protein